MTDRPEQFDEQAPPPLVEQLNVACGRNLRIPAQVDQAILSNARARLLGIRSRKPSPWTRAVRYGAGIAAAAVLLVGLGIAFVQFQARQAAPIASQAPAAETQGREQTILDAYLLARRIQLGQKLSQEWDLNLDGVVTQADAAVMARNVVKLEGGVVR